MRLGLILWPDRDIRQLGDLAAVAEDAGFDDLWWPDHYFARETASTLAVCATRTSRLRLGTAVTSPLLRHPALLASLFATLAEASDGRFVGGLGPGGFELASQLGVKIRSPLGAMRETLEMLRSLLAGERVEALDNPLFPVVDAGLGFAPVPPPIYIAARGPRMMELGGELADGIITHSLVASFVDFVVERVRSGEQSAERVPGTCQIALWMEFELDEDVSRARERLRSRCLYMAGGEYSTDMIPLYGLDVDRVMRLRQAVRNRDPDAARLVDDDMVDAFSIGGSVDRVVDRIDAVRRAGVGELILSLGEGVTPARIQSAARAVKEAIA